VADLIVVVPGITGSVLRRPGGVTVWNRSLGAVGRGVATLPATLSLLALPTGLGDDAPDGPAQLVADGVIGGWHAWPGVHTGDGYLGLLQMARQLDAAAVRSFAYDWRLSNRHTAGVLARQVEIWLNDWRKRTGNRHARVCFLCHSMGGLIVRYYLEVLKGRELASRVITLGTPYSGSVKAVRVITGDAFARIPFVGDAMTRVARTFPALAQLLPIYRCVQAVDGPLTLAEATIPDLPTDAVSDAAAFHSEIASAVARNPQRAYQLHVLVGTRHETLQSVSVEAGRIVYASEQRGVDHRGDGTVATFAAVPPEWRDTSDAEVVAVRHAAMSSAKAVLEATRNKLAPIDLGATLYPPLELGLGLPDVAVAADGIHVVAHSNAENVLLHCSVKDPDSGDVLAEAEAVPLGDGDFSATLSAPTGIWRVEVTAVAELPPVATSDLVLVID
jgi:hypothetical protein